MAGANDKQVGGTHYAGELQHWDLVELYGWDYFQAQIIKYLMRHKLKNGLEDLKKASHFLDKYIEIQQRPSAEPGAGYVNQD
jgi:hypothetical protein